MTFQKGLNINIFPRYVWARMHVNKTDIPTLTYSQIYGPRTLYGFLRSKGTKEQVYEATGTWSVEPEGGTGSYHYKWYHKYHINNSWVLEAQGSGDNYSRFTKTIVGYGKRYIKCTVTSGIQSESKSIEINLVGAFK